MTTPHPQSHGEIARLYDEHAVNRALFENACRSDSITQEAYEVIRVRYNASLKAYHDALGYNDHSERPITPQHGDAK